MQLVFNISDQFCIREGADDAIKLRAVVAHQTDIRDDHVIDQPLLPYLVQMVRDRNRLTLRRRAEVSIYLRKEVLDALGVIEDLHLARIAIEGATVEVFD